MTAATLLPNISCANSLAQATVNILKNAFYLAKQKVELSRKAYKKLISYWGWENEDKKYLKVAKTFKKFSPQDLAQVEPATIFCLANQNKKYAPVIEKLLDRRYITQQTVRELMKQERKPKPFLPEKPTIWRQAKDGRRYCQIPPIHDQETGVILQRMMDSEGKSAQQIVAESLALRKALKEGRLVEVPVTEETKQIEVETQEVTVSESKHNKIDNPQTESDEVIINPTTTQETIEFLSNELFVVVENINKFSKQEVKETEELIARIIDFCNVGPIEEQWNTLASITCKDINALAVVIENSGTYYKEWLLNLAQLLSDAVIENPEKLEWVDKQLRSEALSLISKITAFSDITQNI